MVEEKEAKQVKWPTVSFAVSGNKKTNNLMHTKRILTRIMAGCQLLE